MSWREPRRLWHQLTLAEVSGSLGDLGTLVPLLVAMAQAGAVDFVPALFFAGLFNVVTGLSWDVPMCVQPMKTIAAVALADGLTRVQVSLAGLLVAAMVFVLGATRGIVVVNNVVPLAVVRGMQLGLGLSLVRKGLRIVVDDETFGSSASCTIGAICFVVILFAQQHWQHRRVPIALVVFLFGLVLASGHAAVIGVPFDTRPVLPLSWALRNATGADVSHALFAAALPQLPLTTLNSIVSVCRLSHDLFPERRVTQTSVALSVSVMNGVGCLFGAMPACHGAGGLAAQFRFGARSGSSMLLLGGSKILFALLLGPATLSLLAVYPGGVMGVLLCFSGLELALAARHLKGENEMTIALITAGTTLALKTGIGCAVGLVASLLCGGYEQVLMLVRSHRLGETLLRDAGSQALLLRAPASSASVEPPCQAGSVAHAQREPVVVQQTSHVAQQPAATSPQEALCLASPV